jgi:hypothetical protein
MMIKLIDILSENIENRLISEQRFVRFPSPVGPAEIKSGSGVYNAPRGDDRRHKGIDLVVPSNTPIKSPFDGEVIDSGFNDDNCGGVIYIRHDNGYKTRYCHCKEINVNTGDRVSKGQVIGRTGGESDDRGTGNSDYAHLHFELYNNSGVINPTRYVNLRGGDDSENETIRDRIERLRDEGMSTLSIASLLGIDVEEVEAKLEEFQDNLANYNKLIGQEYDYDDPGGVVSPPRDYENTLDEFNSYIDDMFSEYEKNDMEGTDVEMLNGQEFFIVKRKNGKKRYYFYRNSTFVPTNL